jgi:hypothetical protein
MNEAGKLTAFEDIAPHSLVEAERDLKGVCCLHRQGYNGVISQRARKKVRERMD